MTLQLDSEYHSLIRVQSLVILEIMTPSPYSPRSAPVGLYVKIRYSIYYVSIQQSYYY